MGGGYPVKITVGSLAGANAIRCYAGGSVTPTHLLTSKEEIGIRVRTYFCDQRPNWPSAKALAEEAHYHGLRLKVYKA